MDRRNSRSRRRLAGVAAFVALTVGGVATGAGAQTATDDQTWVGQVEKHGRHYDYLGRSCPIESTDACPDYVVRYQIVPSSTQAARALPKVAGHRARLIGHKELVREPGHNGTLVVSEVQSNRAPGDPVTGEPSGR